MKTSRGAALAVWVFSGLSVAACAREGTGLPDVALDTNAYDARFEYPDSGVVVVRDAAGFDSGPSTGLQCETCETAADCQGGAQCAPLGGSEQRVCLATCDRDLPDCPVGFECVENLASGSPEPLCTPVGTRCCVDADGDDRGVGVGCRAPDCNDEDPAAYFGARELCNGQDDDCDGTVDEENPEGGLVCSTGMMGACAAGTTTCEAGTLVCRAGTSSTPEACNGVDDDCDANVDEDDMGRALSRPCYEGPAGTEGRGACTAGVQTCAGGEYRSCVGQVTPGTEDCDGLDDDCDGDVDDGNPGGGFACVSSSPGACAAGTTQCRAGVVSCVGTIAPGTNPEICDDLDNDCDGMLNEGFPGLGSACVSGRGSCRRGGVTICNAADRAAAPVCDAVPGMPTTEVCNFVDDDCDGSSDEGFADAMGRFTLVTACGACGNDCNLGWPGGAAALHVIPTCTSSGATSSCGYMCEPGWGDVDRIRENGCEFSPEPGTIYVSTPANRGMDTASCGAFDAPCATIGTGISRAMATSRTRVRVSEGLYTENVTVQNGISVLGGHSSVNWVRNPLIYGTILRGANVASSVGSASDRVVVAAVSITTATELSGFSIEGISALQGGNSVGIYVRDSTNALTIQDNLVTAGPGGSGTDGGSGTAGAGGGVGSRGTDARRASCGGAATAGGPAATLSCGGTSVSGGTGGAGTAPVAGSPSGAGVAGSGPSAGAGGAAGNHMSGTTTGMGTRCIVSTTPTDGAPGGSGGRGTDGGGGAGGSGASSIVGGQWRGTDGVVGASGANGGGGGGGGSPGGVSASTYCLYPPSGGGGGAGGCGGIGGQGGDAGGASFAIHLIHTSAPTAATMPRLLRNQLRRGIGGRGGDGGTGGGGGDGGLGGAGGANPTGTWDTFSFCLSNAANGGAGGRGGHGGGGGGGAGGVSYDIWVSRPGTAMPDLSTNTFVLSAGTATGGAGGSGGNSSNTTTGLGTAGTAGTFGTSRVGT